MERKRLPVPAREALNAMFAMHSVMTGFEEQFKHMSRRIPNGWRDFRLIQSKMAKMLEDILDTIPLEQLQVIKRHMEISSIHLGVSGVKPKDYWLMTHEDLADLADYATKTTCFACTDTDKPCRLREILKNLPIKDVDTILVGCWKED